jgi:hypothetical protein
MKGRYGIGKNFLTRTPIAQEIRARIDKWDYMKLKSFCTAKATVTRRRGHLTVWENVFASYLPEKGFISRIDKSSKTLNLRRTNNAVRKWVNEFNRQFSEEEVIAANKYLMKY